MKIFSWLKQLFKKNPPTKAEWKGEEKEKIKVLSPDEALKESEG